jgi:hypothetical protein
MQIVHLADSDTTQILVEKCVFKSFHSIQIPQCEKHIIIYVFIRRLNIFLCIYDHFASMNSLYTVPTIYWDACLSHINLLNLLNFFVSI